MKEYGIEWSGEELNRMIKIEDLENNLIKLFKGDLPLYKSYWIYYVLGNFLISAPLLLSYKNSNPKIYLLIFFILVLI